jgi:hypothetical protein
VGKKKEAINGGGLADGHHAKIRRNGFEGLNPRFFEIIHQFTPRFEKAIFSPGISRHKQVLTQKDKVIPRATRSLAVPKRIIEKQTPMIPYLDPLKRTGENPIEPLLDIGISHIIKIATYHSKRSINGERKGFHQCRGANPRQACIILPRH